MKKGKGYKKEIQRNKSRRIKNPIVNKRTSQRQPPDPWKEIRLKLKPLGKLYNNFMEKRKIVKQKEERRRLNEQEEQKQREEEAQKLQEQEEKIL